MHTAFERAHRLAGKAEQEAAPTLDAALLEEGAERDLAQALQGAQIDDALRGRSNARTTCEPVLRRGAGDGGR